MSENTVYNYADTSTRLAKVIQDLDVEIRVSEQSMKLKTKYEEDIYPAYTTHQRIGN